MKETLFTATAAIGAGIMATLLGGWDKAMEILSIFMVIDYVTGIASAMKLKTLRSSVGFEGIFKKGSIFLVVILAVQLDRLTGTTIALFRSATCFFFIANEGLSILENLGEIGVKLPAFMKKTLKKLRDDNDDLANEGSDSENDEKN